MKKKLLVPVLLFTLLMLTACSNKKTINLELKPQRTDGKITIVVKSNLPKDTMASLTMINKEDGYVAQDSFKIDGKETSSNVFSNQGEALAPGTYDLTLVIPVTEAQPESVMEELGENFKNIESEYLIELDEYKYLEKSITFTID